MDRRTIEQLVARAPLVPNGISPLVGDGGLEPRTDLFKQSEILHRDVLALMNRTVDVRDPVLRSR